MKIKTTDLIGVALDWAVAKCECGDGIVDIGDPHFYSTDWRQGMPILDRVGICVRLIRKMGHPLDGTYMAMEARRLGTGESSSWGAFCWPEKRIIDTNSPRIRWDGPTYLIAGLRCYVGITLGDEVEIPDELLEV